MTPWHSTEPEEVVARLKSNPTLGLTPREAKRRLHVYGANEISTAPPRSRLAIFFGQFEDFMVLVLLGATAVSALMGEMADALTIVAIVILNALLGYLQESRAEHSLQSLRQLSAPVAHAVRAGAQRTIPASELVPGDLVLLSQGDKVAADCRLIWSSNLEVDESALTGESFGVRKRYRDTLPLETALADRTNMVYAGTNVIRGSARAVVTSTANLTEVGQIATSIAWVQHEPTPLQKRLDRLGRVLVVFCLSVCAVVGISGVLRGEPIYRMILVGVSLAVAAIPEGLPAVVTVSLALGVQRMARKKAIVRRLPAVETLGCATVICTDKTGTITRNEMSVREIVTAEAAYAVSGGGYRLDGGFSINGKPIDPTPTLKTLLLAALLCNNAWVEEAIEARQHLLWEGDPTEVALLVCALKAGFRKEVIENEHPRLAEVPFESERRRMSVVNAFDGEMFAFVKGAPDAVLERCSRMLHSRGQAEIDDDVRARFIKQADEMAGRALRVLGVARRKLQHVPEDPDSDYVEHDLTFLGLIGIIDPPREEVKAAIKRCHRAGIRTVMITGDHQKTAESIACEVGLLDQGERSISGLEIECLDDKQMQDVVRRANVFARVSPKHKIRIVNALRATGEVVAMTGDGVNDAPAVKAADIGIAMGISGTDVTKEASSMVLSDDNFATIVAAVEEGRAIYANIRKFIRYLLSCNVGEVMVMFLASLLGYPVPLLPIQVLWVNLVTDGLPAIALGLDPPGRDLMAEAPRLTGESIFARGLGRRIIVRGCLIALGSLVMFILSYESGGDLARARTVAFATLVMFQLFHVFECRCERGSVFEVGVLGNKPLLLAVGSSLCMMLLVLYVPKAAAVFSAVRLGAIDWLLIFGVSGLSTLIAGLRHASRR